MKKVPIISINTGEIIKDLQGPRFRNPKRITYEQYSKLIQEKSIPMIYSGIGYYVATYSQMRKLFNMPNKLEQKVSFSKISTQWLYKFTDTRSPYPLIVAFSDYKATRLYDDEYPSPSTFRQLHIHKVYPWEVSSNKDYETTYKALNEWKNITIQRVLV